MRTIALAALSLTLLVAETGDLPAKSNSVLDGNLLDGTPWPITQITYVDRPLRTVSLDFGDKTDQHVLLDYFRKQGTVVAADWTRYAIPSTTDQYAAFTAAKQHTARLDALLDGADIVHLSGHYRSNVLFAGERIDDSTYSYVAACAPALLSIHEQARLVMLGACAFLQQDSRISHSLSTTFPNAVLVGYAGKSPNGTINAQIFNRFFTTVDAAGGIVVMDKQAISEAWFDAAQAELSQSALAYCKPSAIYLTAKRNSG